MLGKSDLDGTFSIPTQIKSFYSPDMTSSITTWVPKYLRSKIEICRREKQQIHADVVQLAGFFTELIGERLCLSDCSAMAMAMFRWGSLSAFQPAKDRTEWLSGKDITILMGVSGSNLMVMSEDLPCFLLD